MKKSSIGNMMLGMGIGAGSAALYMNIKNGNMRKLVRKMNSAKTKAISNLENMMQKGNCFSFFFNRFVTWINGVNPPQSNTQYSQYINVKLYNYGFGNLTNY